MRRLIGIFAALTWLGFLAMVTGMDQARFDRPAVILGIIAVCGFILALAFAFSRSQWVMWLSLLLSIPIACWNVIWLFHLVSLLQVTSRFFSGAHAHALPFLGQPAFQWFSLAVTLLIDFDAGHLGSRLLPIVSPCHGLSNRRSRWPLGEKAEG